MDSDTKQLFIIVTGIVFTISVLTLSIAWYHVATTKAAMENGYTTEVLPGSSFPQWVKTH